MRRLAFRASFDFFNIFNKVDYGNPGLRLDNASAFGVITTEYTPPNRVDGGRWIQVGARVEFSCPVRLASCGAGARARSPIPPVGLSTPTCRCATTPGAASTNW